MLNREMLTDEAWTIVRNTPHFVVLAVSGAGDGAFDAMLERHAGMKGIVEAMHSTHPLLRHVAEASQILEGQESVRSWIYALPEQERTQSRLQEKALDCMREALAVLAAQGTPEDVSLYRDFVMALAMRVARAAREGDVLGIDGVRVSAGEVEFIDALKGVAAPQAA